MRRISAEELRSALREARAVAEHTSRCLRKKVGAVLFANDGRFLSYGANINPPGEPCDEGFCPRGRSTYDEVPVDAPYADCTATHAEKIAVKLGLERIEGNAGLWPLWAEKVLWGGTIVVTHEPCHECMPALQKLKLNVYWPEGQVLR